MNSVLTFRRAATAAVVAAAAAGAPHVALAQAPAAASVPAGSRPNIVVILADDMGYSDAGFLGSEIPTPNLDKLAAGGVVFTQFYNTARCCPTRASLLTGLYPHQADVGHMVANPVPDVPGYRNDLSHDAVTIAEVLGPAGYETYMTGKWHVTIHENPRSRDKSNWPRQRGFDRFYGMITGGGSYFDPAALVRDNTPVTPESDTNYKPSGSRYYFTDAIADHSARFIREHKEASPDKPFFMYVAFTAPHWPLHAMPEDLARYKGKYDAGYEPVRVARLEKMKSLGIVDASTSLTPAPVSWNDIEHKAWEARCMEVYAAQVDRMDQNIGKIITSLRETGQLDNTLVLFLQDNGGCAEDMGRLPNPARDKAKPLPPRKPTDLQTMVFPTHTPDGRPIYDGLTVMPGGDDSYTAYGQGWANVSNTPFREYKHWVHEGGVATPLLAHWPAGIARKGELERQPGHLIDVMATCLAVSGARYPKKTTTGHDVLPPQGVSLLPAFDGRPLNRPEPIFFEHEGNRAVRDGRWKLVAKGAEGAWELYDMEADRAEMRDLAAAQPARVNAMAAQWQHWAEASNVLPLNPWQKKRGGQVH